MLMHETYVNVDKNACFGESDWFEPWTEDTGKLYKDLVREYGRCVSSVYIDQENSPPLRVGWVFRKRMKYEDSPDTYIREVWVELAESVETPKRVIKHLALASR